MEHAPNGLRVGARAAAGGRRLPGHAGRARADRRRRDHQAGARPRRAEPARADGVVGRGGACGRRGGALPAARPPRRRLGRSPGRRAGTASTATSRMPTSTCRCSSRSRRPRASRPPPRSPRSTASTASSSDRPTWPRRWACSASSRIRTSSPPCCAPSTAVRGCGQAGRRQRLRPGRRRTRYLDAGASFVLVGADVTLLARGSEALAARFVGTHDGNAGH